MSGSLVRDLVGTTPDLERLEALVDRYSLANVVEGLVRICGDKAEHIREAWQDYGLAKNWDVDAKTLDRVIAKLRNAG